MASLGCYAGSEIEKTGYLASVEAVCRGNVLEFRHCSGQYIGCRWHVCGAEQEFGLELGLLSLWQVAHRLDYYLVDWTFSVVKLDAASVVLSMHYVLWLGC